MKNRRTTRERPIRNTKATRYMAIAFTVLALALLTISAFSYLAAREVQKKYNGMVSDSLHKLELINRLHHNEDRIYNAAVKHFQTSDSAAMIRLEQEILSADSAVVADLKELSQLIIYSNRKAILKNYTENRQQFTIQLTRLLALSRQNRTGDELSVETEELMPSYRRHQVYLNSLGDSISITTRQRGDQALKTIDQTIRNYNLLLLAALLVTASAAFLIRRVLQQLRFHDIILSTEIRERKQLKDALSESQVIYRSLFRNISIPMWIFDEKSLRVLEVNTAAIEEYGYTRDEFLSLNIMDLQPEKQKQELREHIAKHIANVSNSLSWQHKRKDGSTFFVDVKTHGLPAQANYLPRIVVALNIDDRVQAIRALERREKQLLEISSSIPGAVYQFQLDEQMNFSLPFLSEGIRNLVDLTPEQAKADPKSLFTAIHPEDVEPFWDSILESYHTMKPWICEFRAFRKSQNKYIWLRGHSLPTHRDNKVVTWNGTLIDITEQKEAQEKLVASEANLRYLLNSSPQAIYLLDDQLKVIAYNAKASEEVNSIQLKMLRAGESILSFISADQVNKTIKYHELALKGETTVYETHNAGIWHEVAFRPVLGPDQQVLAVALSVQDITEHKTVLEAIKHNEMLLARAQELSHMGSWEYDLVSGKVIWSDNLYKIYDLTPETFTPTLLSVRQLVHPDDAGLVQEKYAEAYKTGEPTQIEHRVITPSGEEKTIIQIGEILFDDYGKPLMMSGTVQDITERKRVEREITEAKNLLQSTLENIPEIIFSTDAFFSITYISPQCLDILGYTDQELTGTHEIWTKNIYPDDLPKVESVKSQLYKGERAEYEVRVISQDKQIKWLLLRLTPTLDKQGRMVRLDGSAADISQQKIAEAKREVLHNQLLTQNRNLQQFAYIVSHNLRAPIANILGLTSIYNKTNPGAPVNKQVIDNLYKSAQLLDNTIRDLNELLTLRRELQDDMKEELYFSALLEDVKASLEEEIQEAHATIEADFENAPAVVTIKSYLQSILLNLVSNAIKYRDHNRKLKIKVKSFVVDDYICLQVIDNGLGINLQKEKDKIFGLYKRFHPAIAGRGLGLHLVKTQAELLGGKVDVESSVGVGTVFSVYFLNSSVVHELIEKSSIS